MTSKEIKRRVRICKDDKCLNKSCLCHKTRTCCVCGVKKSLVGSFYKKEVVNGKVLYDYACIECKLEQARIRKTGSYNPEIRDATTRRMNTKYPHKYKARYTLRNAVRLGKIKKPPCEVCGEVKVEAHHDDYSKPLNVRWLCMKHHKGIHSALIKGDKE